MSRRPTILLFDIDGTLITCGGAGRDAMERAYAERLGAGPAPRFRFAGGTDLAIARRFLEEAGAEPTDEAVDGFLAAYLRHLPDALAASRAFRVFDGVTALLDRLAALPDIAIGLGTGNLEAGAYAKLRRGGLDARFAFGGFGSDHVERARLLARGAERGAAQLGRLLDACEVVVLGDTERDVAAAHAIGARCVGVATGPLSVEELRDAGAHHVVDGLGAPGLYEHLVG